MTPPIIDGTPDAPSVSAAAIAPITNHAIPPSTTRMPTRRARKPLTAQALRSSTPTRTPSCPTGVACGGVSCGLSLTTPSCCVASKCPAPPLRSIR